MENDEIWHPLGDGLVLSNLQWLRRHSHLAQQPGTTDQRGALSFGFLVGRIKAVTGEDWSEAKVRKLFGSRAKQLGPPRYRWFHILILAEALDVSVLDVLLPNPDRHDRKDLEEEASIAFGLPLSAVAAENRGKLGYQRRYEVLLEQAVDWHPSVMLAWDLGDQLSKQGHLIDGDSGGRTIDDVFRIADTAVRTIKNAIHRSGKKSPTLEALANEAPPVARVRETTRHGTHISGGDKAEMTEVLALQILEEFGVIDPTEGEADVD